MLGCTDCSGGRIEGAQYILRYLARIATGDRRLYGGDAFSAVQASACRLVIATAIVRLHYCRSAYQRSVWCVLTYLRCC